VVKAIAYQETLGDFHNLFGDTNVASVRVDARGQLEFVHELKGDSVAEVLGYVEHQPKELYRRFHDFAERSVRESRITVKERQQMLKLFLESLDGSTYFKG
jgi:arginine decarboxylase